MKVCKTPTEFYETSERMEKAVRHFALQDSSENSWPQWHRTTMHRLLPFGSESATLFTDFYPKLITLDQYASAVSAIAPWKNSPETRVTFATSHECVAWFVSALGGIIWENSGGRPNDSSSDFDLWQWIIDQPDSVGESLVKLQSITNRWSVMECLARMNRERILFIERLDWTLVRKQEIRDRLDIGETSFRNKLKSGEIPCHPLGDHHHHIRVLRDWLDSLPKSNPHTPAPVNG